jgi:hypothetical protein
MTASPWPPYLFFAPCVEYAAPRVIGVRDWFRLKVLLSPSGGLSPDEARFWITHRDPRDEAWHEGVDSSFMYMAAHWCDLLDLGRHLPVHIVRWTVRRAEQPLDRTAADGLERSFKSWSHSERLNW